MLLAKVTPLSLCFLLALAGGNLLPAADVCAKIRDYADLPLRGARTVVLNLQTSRMWSALADPKGRACISGIPEGLYSVEVGLAGFLNVRYYPVRISYPATTELQFQLPFAEITEGGLAPDAVVSGTLKRGGEIMPGAKICLIQISGKEPMTCGTSNELGEYALSVPPGKYKVEVTSPRQPAYGSMLDIPAPGIYRNRIAIGDASRP